MDQDQDQDQDTSPRSEWRAELLIILAYWLIIFAMALAATYWRDVLALVYE
jgi:hypothetical protein